MSCSKTQILHCIQQELCEKKNKKLNSTFRLKEPIFGGLFMESILRFKNKGPIFEGRGL